MNQVLRELFLRVWCADTSARFVALLRRLKGLRNG